jgi:HEAT repeat protein
VLKNGNALRGKVVSHNPNFVTIDVNGMTLRVLRSMIDSTDGAGVAKAASEGQGSKSRARRAKVAADTSRAASAETDKPPVDEGQERHSTSEERVAKTTEQTAHPAPTTESGSPAADSGDAPQPPSVSRPASEKEAKEAEVPKKRGERLAREKKRGDEEPEAKSGGRTRRGRRTTSAGSAVVAKVVEGVSTAGAAGGAAAAAAPRPPLPSTLAPESSSGKPVAKREERPLVSADTVPEAGDPEPAGTEESQRVVMATETAPEAIKPSSPVIVPEAESAGDTAARRKPGFVYPGGETASVVKPAPADSSAAAAAGTHEKEARVEEVVLRSSIDERQLLEEVTPDHVPDTAEKKVLAISPSRRDYLAERLETGGPEERIEAAVELGKSRAPWAAELLADALSDQTPLSVAESEEEVLETSTSVGTAVGRTLGMMGEAALEPVRKALGHRNAVVRRNAAVAMTLIPGERSTRALIETLEDDDVEVQLTAVTELAERKPVALLIEAVNSRDANVRRNAIEVLGEIREKRAADHIIVALTDRNSSVREKAAWAIGRIGDPRAGDALLTCMKDGISFVRRNAALALGRIREPRAVDVLITALKDESPFVRRAAAQALGTFRNTRAIEPLVQASKDSDPDVAAAATKSLHLHTDIGSLIQSLDDESPVVRKNAEYALFLMTGQDHGSDHESWKRWWARKTGTPAGDEE